MIMLNDNVSLWNSDEFKGKIEENVAFFDFLNDRERTIHLLKKYMKSKNKNIEIIVIKNYDLEVIDVFKAFYIADEKQRMEFIYDKVCEALDEKWDREKPCNFCENRCLAARNNFMDEEEDGCCYSFKRKRFGRVEKSPCRYLGIDKKCTTSNLSCKLFTCSYLKKHSKFLTDIDDYLLLRLFLNKKQRLIAKYNFFKNKEEVIGKLLEKSKKPYLLYLFFLDFAIDHE